MTTRNSSTRSVLLPTSKHSRRLKSAARSARDKRIEPASGLVIGSVENPIVRSCAYLRPDFVPLNSPVDRTGFLGLQ
ncbi:hypothetical protein AOLI_G00322290 [Acnodon oligacanthus]